jgi:anion-transporting  ArsA/GET3 family ATPase
VSDSDHASKGLDGKQRLSELTSGSRVVICVGPGGVGKTTCAAAIALEGARLGRKACVVTIDPAKRLADALGLEELSNKPRLVDTGSGPGELWALMLDTKATFDEVIGRNAASDDQAQAILDNRLYRNISGALGGTQEYMAMEKLFERHSSGGFDLLVVDTPPTRHALDFLDAPGRLLRFLNNRVFRLLMTPTKAGLKAIGMATHLFLRTVSKVVGGAVVDDAVGFFAAFEGMEQGFRERAARVEELLGDPSTSFVVIASPRRDAVTEAIYLAGRLRESSCSVAALVVNRMFPNFGPADDIPAQGGAEVPLGRWSPVVDSLLENLADLSQVSGREEQYVTLLAEQLPGTPMVRVPFLADDVHDTAGLAAIGEALFDRGEAVA